VDWSDRNSCILFGDGAGAAVVSAVDSSGESGKDTFHVDAAMVVMEGNEEEERQQRSKFIATIVVMIGG